MIWILFIMNILGNEKIIRSTTYYEKIPVIVHLSEKPEFEVIKNLSPQEYVEFLKNFSKNSQKNILDYLKNNFYDKIEDLTPYWIFNGFYMKATRDVIEKISQRKEVEYITYDFEIRIDKSISYEEIMLEPTWNIRAVRADSCWMIGYTGANTVIGHMGTGVEASHPALEGKWLSPYWYDAVNNQPYPYDDNGTGTHSIGVILGSDGFGPFSHDIGVAPSAKFVACKCFNNQGTGYSSWIHASFQKFAEWKSMGVQIVAVYVPFSGPSSMEWWNDILNLRNMDIISICTWAGGSPGDYGIAISLTPDSLIHGFIDTLYGRRGVKPNLAAPGKNITSSIPGGGYSTISARFLPASHLVGGWAILKEAVPFATICTLYYYFTEYAYRPVPPDTWPNTWYGWGWLNIYQALIHLLGQEIKENSEKINKKLKISERYSYFKIFDLSGRLIYTPCKNDKKSFRFKKGIYFLILNGNSKKILSLK